MTDLKTLGELVHTEKGRPWTLGNERACEHAVAVRRDGKPIDISLFEDVIASYSRQVAEGGGRATSDAALAPRVHASLRLTRREASDPGIWGWLAGCVASDYVRWRWSSRATAKGNTVQPERWHGPIHKQAIARLWWGMELFRNGPDYPKGLFEIQDVPNSVLHRPFVRNRPLAVALEADVAKRIMVEGKEGERQLRRWFSAINLYGGSRDLAALSLFHRDDAAALNEWVREAPRADDILGPPDRRVSEEALSRARSFLGEVWKGAVIGLSSR